MSKPDRVPTPIDGGEPAASQKNSLLSTAAAYLMVLPVSMFDVSATKFAAESAFCEHLRQMRSGLGDRVSRLVVATPVMSSAKYESARAHLGEIDSELEGISHVPLFAEDSGSWRLFWQMSTHVVPALYREVERSAVVHSGISPNIYRPIEMISLLMAFALGKKTVAVNDIDRRNSAWMNWKSGAWPLKSYAVTRFVYDPISSLQLKAVVRMCSLTLLKGRKMVDDYGRDGRGEFRPSVRYFLDAAFNASDLIPEAALAKKLRTLENPKAPLELSYFGRLTAYKGIDHCLRAVRVALDRGAGPLRFHIIGAGEEDARLRALSQQLNLDDVVVFHGAVRFGPALFDRLREQHVLMAAPLSEDTPRSALDAMASGMSILSYDTYYYRELAESGAVELAPWLDIDALGARIAAMSQDRMALVERARAAVAFAQQNTQEIWLDRRFGWLRTLV